MPEKINLSVSLHYFRDPQNLDKLNRHLRLHRDFMLHQIAVATGCTLADAMLVMLLLYHYRHVKAVLLVYDVLEPTVPILRRTLEDGPPTLPIISSVDEREITKQDELRYGFLFELESKIPPQFVTTKEHV